MLVLIREETSFLGMFIYFFITINTVMSRYTLLGSHSIISLQEKQWDSNAFRHADTQRCKCLRFYLHASCVSIRDKLSLFYEIFSENTSSFLFVWLISVITVVHIMSTLHIKKLENLLFLQVVFNTACKYIITHATIVCKQFGLFFILNEQ